MRILMITSEWPTPQYPHSVPFIVRQVEFLRYAGVDVDVFHFRGAKNPMNYIRAWHQVRRRLAAERYDLVHAQWGQSLLVALPKQLPLVVTFRGSDLAGLIKMNGRDTWQGRLLAKLSQRLALSADEVIVVSKHLLAFLPQQVKAATIPSGLNLELFRPLDQCEARQALGLPEQGVFVLFGGDPAVTGKRFPLAQRAMILLQENIQNVALIPLHGIEHIKMPFYMNAADALLLTSIQEGSPNVVKEALACNLPVVSTDVGDVRERIQSIDGCVVCGNDRPETIADGLRRVLSNRQRINGWPTVQELDERTLTQKVIQIYRQAIQKAKYPRRDDTGNDA